MYTIEGILNKIKVSMEKIYDRSELISIEKEELSNKDFIDAVKLRQIIRKRETPLLIKCISDIDYLLENKNRIMIIIMKEMNRAKTDKPTSDYMLIYQEFNALFDFLEKMKVYLLAAKKILSQELTALKSNGDSYKISYYKEYEISDSISALFHEHIEPEFDVSQFGISGMDRYVYSIKDRMKSHKRNGNRRFSLAAIAASILLLITLSITSFAKQEKSLAKYEQSHPNTSNQPVNQESIIQKAPSNQHNVQELKDHSAYFRNGYATILSSQGRTNKAANPSHEYHVIASLENHHGKFLRISTGHGVLYVSAENALLIHRLSGVHAVVNAEKLNVRQYPSEHETSLALANQTDRFEVMGEITLGNNKWFQIRFPSSKLGFAFIAAEYSGHSYASIRQGNLKEVIASEESKVKLDQQIAYNFSILISDEEFTNSQSMTQTDIQSFLELNNSVLAHPYRTADGREILPSEAIFKACYGFGINPKVILTKLQVEQSLITKTTASTHKMDWALGFGATDRGRIAIYSGFDKQIHHAARRLQELYREGKRQRYPFLFTNMNYKGRYGGPKSLNIVNASTYALYRYTPHTYDYKLGHNKGGGNYLFLTFYKKYSQQVIAMQIQGKEMYAMAR